MIKSIKFTSDPYSTTIAIDLNTTDREEILQIVDKLNLEDDGIFYYSESSKEKIAIEKMELHHCENAFWKLYYHRLELIKNTIDNRIRIIRLGSIWDNNDNPYRNTMNAMYTRLYKELTND